MVSGWMCTNNWSYCENAKISGGSGPGGVWSRGVRSGWCHGGCVQRIQVIVKMQKKVGGSVEGGGVRVDVYKELIEAIVKKKIKPGAIARTVAMSLLNQAAPR